MCEVVLTDNFTHKFKVCVLCHTILENNLLATICWLLLVLSHAGFAFHWVLEIRLFAFFQYLLNSLIISFVSFSGHLYHLIFQRERFSKVTTLSFPNDFLVKPWEIVVALRLLKSAVFLPSSRVVIDRNDQCEEGRGKKAFYYCHWMWPESLWLRQFCLRFRNPRPSGWIPSLLWLHTQRFRVLILE